MAVNDVWYDYSVLTPGDTFANGETTKAVALGGTQAIVSNGVFAVNADSPSAFVKQNCLTGTTQSASGTSYITHTITGTNTLSITIVWRMPFSVGTIGGAFFWCGAGSSRVAAFSLLSTEQIRFFSASGGTLFTSTYSGGFVPGTWYKTKFHITQGSTTSNGRLAGETYEYGSSTALTGTVYDSGTTVNMGTTGSPITTLRHGTRAGTGTADENLRVRMGYNRTAAYLMDDEPLAGTNYTKSIADPVGITDTSGDQQVGYGLGLADPVGATDLATSVMGRSQALADPVGVTDSATMGAGRASADAVSLSDNATASLGRSASSADGVGISDSLAVQLTRGVIISDGVGVADSSGGTRTIQPAGVADPVGITDSPSSALGRASAPADPVGITDDVTLSLVSEGAFTAGDAVGIADDITVALARQATVADGVGVSDNATRVLQDVVAQGDGVALSDTIAVARNYVRIFADGVGIEETAEVVGEAHHDLAVDESVAISDELNVFLDRIVLLEDGLGISDESGADRKVPPLLMGDAPARLVLGDLAVALG